MTLPLNLTTALADHFANDVGDRGDEQSAHVSDLAGCDRETWARRNGADLLPFDLTTRMKFALGNATEDTIALALQSETMAGWVLQRNVRVALSVDDQGLKGRILMTGEEPTDDEVVGHVDYVLYNNVTGGVTVVEVKSTTFFPRRGSDGKNHRVPPEDAKYHYRLQAAGYAVGVGAAAFCVLVVCRDSGMIAEFWYRTDAYLEELRDRVQIVLASTPPGAPEPPAEPPIYAQTRNGNWRCAYCRNVSCPKNVNAAAMVV